MAQPVKRNGIFWFRKKVPEELRPILDKTEEKFSLKTRDPAEAKVRFSKALAEIEERWSRLKGGETKLSHRQCIAIAGEIYRAYVRKNEENPDPQEFLIDLGRVVFDDKATERTPEQIRNLPKNQLPRYINTSVAKYHMREIANPREIDRFLKERGLLVDDPTRERIRKAVSVALIQAEERVLELSKGNYSPDPVEQRFPQLELPPSEKGEPVDSRVRLSKAISEWVTEKSRKGGEWVLSSAEDNKLWAERFLEMAGDHPLSEYRKSHAREFKTALLCLPPNFTRVKGFKNLSFVDAVKKARETKDVTPMSGRNVNKVLGFLSAFWNWAAANYDDCPANLFGKQKLKLKVRARDERDPFSSSDLKAIFESPLYTGCLSEKAWRTKGSNVFPLSGLYWLPLIALFTGARSGEIIQLRCEDIATEDKILYFNICDEGDDQIVKTDESVRKIPVHSKLMELGFEHFYRTRKKSGGRLFPEFPKAVDGYYSTAFSPRFNRFLKDLKIKTPKKTFHSFRHNFEDACRRAGLTLEMTNSLQGHSMAGMAARYGDGEIPINYLFNAMFEIDYEYLDFSKLHAARTLQRKKSTE